MVHRQHRRVVREAENETAVNQPPLIGRHRRRGPQTHRRPAGFEVHRMTAEDAIDGVVGPDLHLAARAARFGNGH